MKWEDEKLDEWLKGRGKLTKGPPKEKKKRQCPPARVPPYGPAQFFIFVINVPVGHNAISHLH